MTYALRAIGLAIGHEMPGADGVVGWQQLCPEHPYTLDAIECGTGRELVHLMQMRHPVPSINSMVFQFENQPPWLTNDNYMFHIETADTPLMKAMRVYYHMNRLGMENPAFKIRYRIEDVDSAWPGIMDAIGRTGQAMPDIPGDVNTRRQYKYPCLDWQDIHNAFPLYGDYIKELSERMGYEKT